MVWIYHQQRLPSSLYDLRRDFLELCEGSLRASQAMASRRLCVRLLSGATVYEGPCPHSLAELRDKVVAAMGCQRKDELVFCSGDAVLDCIEDAGEEITAVRDQVVGLLKEFMWHAYKDELPVRLWPAREHRRLILAAVAINGYALRHASREKI